MKLFKNEQNKKPKKQLHKGFSLIEILIAFTVLTITVIACTDLIASTIRNNVENTYRIQAYFLAEQGVEAVRNIRDSNWTQNIGFRNVGSQSDLWGSAIYPEGEDLFVQVSPLLLEPNIYGATWNLTRTTDSGGQLYISKIGNLEYYTHNSTSDSIPSEFRRVIKLSKTFQDFDEITTSEENDLKEDLIYVTSTVYYNFRGQEKNVNIKTILTDWKEGPL